MQLENVCAVPPVHKYEAIHHQLHRVCNLLITDSTKSNKNQTNPAVCFAKLWASWFILDVADIKEFIRSVSIVACANPSLTGWSGGGGLDPGSMFGEEGRGSLIRFWLRCSVTLGSDLWAAYQVSAEGEEKQPQHQAKSWVCSDFVKVTSDTQQPSVWTGSPFHGSKYH